MLEDDQLVELFVERPESERMVGSLFKGIVRRVMVGMSAAFIDIGLSQDAFLHFSDLGGGNDLLRVLDGEDHKAGDGEEVHGNRRRWDGGNLKVGDEIVVQVVKEPIGRKGPRVSTQIAIPGRLIVLIPNESYVGVSRKIQDYREKKRLRQISSHSCPKDFGIIVRTQAEGRSENAVKADIERVSRSWKKITKTLKSMKGTGLVYRDMSMASSIIRDLFSPEMNSLVVDYRKLYREILEYIEDVAPSLTDKIQLYRDRTPIFDFYGIESVIERSLMRKIWLNGGGYIYIDPTEALVAIDVNSGRFVGKKDHEENSLKVNLKAAKEICRQLRLRDVGGIIVIDFIDMADDKNRKKVFDEMRKEMRMDRSKWDIAPISPFGLMEMTRQRIRPSLLYTFREPCPHCEGTGLVSSMETVVTSIERWIKRYISVTRERRLSLTVNPRVHAYLTGGIQSRIARIMWANKIFITLHSDEEIRFEEFRCYSYRQKADVTENFLSSNVTTKA